MTMKTLLLIPLLFTSCAGMDPGTQQILAQGVVDIGKIYVESRSGKQTVPADGPDAPYINDPIHGPNF